MLHNFYAYRVRSHAKKKEKTPLSGSSQAEEGACL